MTDEIFDAAISELAERTIDRLRAELAAALGRMSKLDFERTAAELECDALRALLREAYEWRDTLWPVSTTVRIAAALNKGGDRD